MSDDAKKPRAGFPTADSFQNLEARLGLGFGVDNVASNATYALNAITRNRMLCDMLFRGSWLGKTGVSAIPEDMIRAGVTINSTMQASDIGKLQTSMVRKDIWGNLEASMRWGRLYGGCVGLLMIEGQDPATELRPETVGKGQFRGIYPLDRWMLTPSTSDLVSEFGPSFGKPRFYQTNAASLLPNMKIHHSRVLRFEGDPLPYWQRIAEMGWGLSILEPFYDRLVAFDSTTQGAAQLVYRAHLRVLYLENYREAIAAGNEAMEAIATSLGTIRKFQTSEGLTLLDAKDKMEFQSYTFSGLDLVLIQFAQQLSGALQIPLVRLFGQSPAGLNATGEADIRLYYDAIASKQTAILETPLAKVMDLQVRSEFGMAPPEDFSFDFNPLWQLTAVERVAVAESATRTVVQASDAGLIERGTAMEELRGLQRETGLFGSLSDEEIARARADAPPPIDVDPAIGGADPDQDKRGDPDPEDDIDPAAIDNVTPFRRRAAAE